MIADTGKVQTNNGTAMLTTKSPVGIPVATQVVRTTDAGPNSKNTSARFIEVSPYQSVLCNH